MAYKVVLEVVVDEVDVEGALAETMMIARALANNDEVWPGGRTDDWEYNTDKGDPERYGQKIKCSVTKVKRRGVNAL